VNRVSSASGSTTYLKELESEERAEIGKELVARFFGGDAAKHDEDAPTSSATMEQVLEVVRMFTKRDESWTSPSTSACRNRDRFGHAQHRPRPALGRRSVSFIAVAPPDSPEIDVEDLADAVDAGARIIDVREPDEYTSGHVPGAVSVPLGAVADHLDQFAGDGRTYVICQSGGRSRRACELVAAHGIDATNVAGGTRAWMLSGRPVVAGSRPS